MTGMNGSDPSCDAAACGVVVVGHGTADPVGAGETRRTAELVAALLPDVPVELGFLEVIGPSIAEAVGRLAARGCREVVAAPLLLFAAGHARRDVPEALAAAAAAAGVAVRQSEPLGGHADILALSRRRRHEAVAGLPPVPPDVTRLVMIGRGSSDPRAVCSLCRFTLATCSAGPTGMSSLNLGFVAAARPTLDEAVAAACDPAAGEVRRIIVQPHLLFRGHVEEQVVAAVARGRTVRPDIEWLQAARLGADPLVAQAVLARVLETAPELKTAGLLAAKNISPRPV
jgi:sirohydrochlorin cobaltochelatase